MEDELGRFGGGSGGGSRGRTGRARPGRARARARAATGECQGCEDEDDGEQAHSSSSRRGQRRVSGSRALPAAQIHDEYDRRVRIRPFEIERFYERWEFRAELMLSSSDCESHDARRSCSRSRPARPSACSSSGSATPRSPGSAGAARRRSRHCTSASAPTTCSRWPPPRRGSSSPTTRCSGPGDHVIVETPCYGSALEVARSTGAQVSLLAAQRYEDGWAHDLDELRSLLRAGHEADLHQQPRTTPPACRWRRRRCESVIEICAERSMVLLSDEVYRGLEHDPADTAAARPATSMSGRSR